MFQCLENNIRQGLRSHGEYSLTDALDCMIKLGAKFKSFKVENWFDTELIAAGLRKEKPRSTEAEALVDTGAVKFYLKSSIIRQLGLHRVGEIMMRTMSNRSEARAVFSPVVLEIQGRTGRFDVVEVPDSLPNVVGQIPLEDLDWVVDCKNQKLVANPEHGNLHMHDAF
jgi:predicted aspartyl protease